LAEYWGTQYVVIAVGTPQLRATDADADVIKELVDERLMGVLKTTVVRGRTADKITQALVEQYSNNPEPTDP